MRINRSNIHFYAITLIMVKSLLVFFTVHPLTAQVRVYEEPLKLPAFEGLNRIAESEELRKEAIKLYPLVELSAFNPPRSGY